MAFNYALFAAAGMSVSSSLRRLDIQNAFKFANAMMPERKTNKPLTGKLALEFESNVLLLLQWSDLLGNGFTTYKPEKLEKYINIFTTKKYHKLQKFILKNYDDEDDMSDKELNQWAKDLLQRLVDFTQIAKNTWKIGLKTELTKLDRKYYDYAKEELDNMLDKYVEE